MRRRSGWRPRSRTTPFLLFGFAGVPADLAQTLDDARAPAPAAAPSCRCASTTTAAWGYPTWVHRDVDRSQFVVHDLDEPHLGGLPGRGRRADRRAAGRRGHGVAAARVHRRRRGARGGRARNRCGAADLACAGWRWPHVGACGADVRPGRRRRARDRSTVRPAQSAAAGRLSCRPGPPQAGGRHRGRSRVPRRRSSDRCCAPTTGPPGPRSLRTVVRPRSELARPTVTVAALSAVSAALAGHLRALGDDPSTLGAEVPMTKPPPRLAYNHFGNVGVGLYPDADARRARGSRIADDLAARRSRAAHPAMRAADLAFAATPAPLLRWGMDQFDPDVRAAGGDGQHRGVQRQLWCRGLRVRRGARRRWPPPSPDCRR